MSFLGLDLGTSGLKGLLIDARQVVLAEASAPLTTHHPAPGWSEQEPTSWTHAARAVLDQLKADAPDHLARLSAIGLSGHMHGATLLDSADQVLRPCLLWNDTRAAAEATEMDADPAFRQVTGNIVFPGFTAPKVEWVRRHEPELFERIAKILLPKDYLRLWLTGEHVSDMSDSAGTAWMDVAKRAWSPQLLAKSHLMMAQMPALIEGTQIGGMMRPELLAQFGITGPVSVVGGGGDNAAAAVGTGSVREGDGFVSLGTSGVLLAARDSFAPQPQTAVHSFCHALPGRWYQMGVTLAATDCLNWLSARLNQTPQELSQALPTKPLGPSDLTFLPYLSGERTPHNDSAIRGAFVGLDIAHDNTDLTRAVMEGVAFALADCMIALQSTGARFDQCLAVGGGARSGFWVATLANVLGVPMARPDAGEMGAAQGAALGAARLALAGTTLADAFAKPATHKQVDPDPALRAAYADAHQRYRALYPALRPLAQTAATPPPPAS